MRRVRYCVAASLDGYIAGPDGEYDWIVVDPDIDFAALFEDFDTILMGRKTYQVTRQQQGGPQMPGIKSYVFSNTLRQEDCESVTVSKDPAATLQQLKDESGKDIWLFGGGELFASLLKLGFVDTVEIAIIPVLLGDGVPVLPPAVSSVKLKLTNHVVLEKTGTVSLQYDLI